MTQAGPLPGQVFVFLIKVRNYSVPTLPPPLALKLNNMRPAIMWPQSAPEMLGLTCLPLLPDFIFNPHVRICFRERKRGREKEVGGGGTHREKETSLRCLQSWELNIQPFGAGTALQPMEPPSLGFSSSRLFT